MAMKDKLDRTEEEWKQTLTPEQYKVLRGKGTERPFTGKYEKNKEKGMYVCAACGNPLFSSGTKYDSGSGWPSFYAPVEDSAVETRADSSFGMARTEVLCARCAGHLGHVFDDGPAPTGARYCINSVALDFQPAGGGRQVRGPGASWRARPRPPERPEGLTMGRR